MIKRAGVRVSIGLVFLVLCGQILWGQTGVLPGFSSSKYFNEQLSTIRYLSDVTIHINAPCPDSMRADRPTSLVFFALPNGNTIEWTIGKEASETEDWHFEIQHIGAQTRFLRELIPDRNIVTIYLGNDANSWPAWCSGHSNSGVLIDTLINRVRNIFSDYPHTVVLDGHSGGGALTFTFLNTLDSIPDYIDRIAFLDSEYNYTNTLRHGEKLAEWLGRSDDHYLCAIAYNDSVALYLGQPVVSATGGTWYRSKLMQKKLAEYFTFTRESNSEFLNFFALDGRIQFRLKENPTQAILHTVQVERNGYIQTIASGTSYEGVGYEYYGPRAYTQYIQKLPPENIETLTTHNAANGNLTFNFEPVPHGEEYRLYVSTDGLSFPDTIVTTDNVIDLSSLQSDSLYFFRMQAISPWGKSALSELLAATAGPGAPEVLIVNGFDEEVIFNSGEFIREHAIAFHKNGIRVASASNNTLLTDMLHPEDYPIIDLFAGTDLYQTETVSTDEQVILGNYLENGGKLMVSAVDIGYDLVRRGSATDKEFAANYLKFDYVERSPLKKTSTYYGIEFMPDWPFGAASFNFDDGTHGLYNVSRPNALRAVNGGLPCLAFTDVDTSEGVAAVCFSGLVPNGTQPAKVFVTSIPLATIYPDEGRALLFKHILDYFAQESAIEGSSSKPAAFFLAQNYPNPFNPETTIAFQLPQTEHVELNIYNLRGELVETLVKADFQAGDHRIRWNAGDLSSGVYLFELRTGSNLERKKCLLLK